MSEYLVPILTFVSVMAIGSAVMAGKFVRSRILQQRLYGRHAFGGHEAAFTHQSGFVGAVDQIGRAVTQDKLPHGLRERLGQAGYYDESAPTIYIGAQLFLALIALPLGALLSFAFSMSLTMRVLVVVLVVCILGLAPNVFLWMRRRKRSESVRRHLPDAIDLLEICVSSGMGLDMAWNSVTDEIRGVCPVLADEMALANLEIHLGARRAEALRHMAQRTGVDDISSLVATLVQSERFGTSVAQALRTYADAMRTERSQRAEEQAEKLAVKLLFPMVLFIFPCMLVVILGPAGIKIARVFAGD